MSLNHSILACFFLGSAMFMGCAIGGEPTEDEDDLEVEIVDESEHALPAYDVSFEYFTSKPFASATQTGWRMLTCGGGWMSQGEPSNYVKITRDRCDIPGVGTKSCHYCITVVENDSVAEVCPRIPCN
ncbi:hypothetical protein [Chondromyces crocatus]|uniref:Secreted protein n=1 Tax=Chondromyces crocatus TaxID=52 RepID=A0A0K1EKX4_CHOCO|nr:hypothetical protein [Chondromyces crocatus]AKT41476.1 uncharacterized protein CMC5_056840 [Chondromyces crocatus]